MLCDIGSFSIKIKVKYVLAMPHSKNMAEGKVPFGHDGFHQRSDSIKTPHELTCENVANSGAYGESLPEVFFFKKGMYIHYIDTFFCRQLLEVGLTHLDIEKTCFHKLIHVELLFIDLMMEFGISHNSFQVCHIRITHAIYSK